MKLKESKYRKRGITMDTMLTIDPLGHTYTFVERNGSPTHIASGILYKMASTRLPVVTCYFSPSLELALKNGDLGVEEEYALKLPEAALEKPGLVCEWGIDHVIADGSHRLWRRWKRGDTWFPAYIVPEKVWRHFTILDVPGSGAEWDDFNRNAKVRS